MITQMTPQSAKSLGRSVFPVFRVISSCSGKQQQAIDQLDSRVRGQAMAHGNAACGGRALFLYIVGVI